MVDEPSATLPPELLVAIDGPAGAGKTTVARRVAEALGLPLLDTGAIYRALALVADRRGIDWEDEPGLAGLADGFPISFEIGGAQAQRVRVGDADVTAEIRAPHISEGASKVSAHPAVRAALLEIQRTLGAGGCVAEGRDMGTVVFPDADHKFFLTASPDARARRRHKDLVATQGEGAPSVDSVQAKMERRDARDSTRAAAPLRQADDAVVIDSSALPLDAVIERILTSVRASAPARS